MSDQWTGRLSDYLDGDLGPADRQRLEEHLGSCPECRIVVEDLRRVVARAQALQDREPAGDLWPAIADRIGAAAPAVVDLAARLRRSRRFTLSLPQLAAAAVVVVLLAGGAVMLMVSRGSHRSPRATSAAPSAPAGAVGISPAVMAEGTYDAAVRDLQRILDEGRSRLDTATVRVLERNLGLIDQAIAECRRALAADPASPYLNTHLAATMKQKLELLRRAARLSSART
jgi:anti-sigma factor RsiW